MAPLLEVGHFIDHYVYIISVDHLVRKDELYKCLPHLHQDIANRYFQDGHYAECLHIMRPLMMSKFSRPVDFLAVRQAVQYMVAADDSVENDYNVLDIGINK